MASPKEWGSFHQQEDLTTRLHNILEAYPPGLGILKEFLQNADDAGARKFAIVFDRCGHSSDPADGLIAPGMGAWQGPALLVYNDATFSDGDFDSISHGACQLTISLAAPCPCRLQLVHGCRVRCLSFSLKSCRPTQQSAAAARLPTRLRSANTASASTAPITSPTWCHSSRATSLLRCQSTRDSL